MIKIVGFGNMAWYECDSYPFIPDFLILDDNGTNRCVSKTNETVDMPSTYQKVEVTVLYYDGMWAAIEESGPVLFLASNEKEWRSKRSQELTQEALGIKGNPMKVLQLVSAAGMLQGIDVPGLSRRVHESMTNQDEPLEDVLLRVKKGS